VSPRLKDRAEENGVATQLLNVGNPFFDFRQPVFRVFRVFCEGVIVAERGFAEAQNENMINDRVFVPCFHDEKTPCQKKFLIEKVTQWKGFPMKSKNSLQRRLPPFKALS
jgi:hypothetical protein